jgi:hypothetical protein
VPFVCRTDARQRHGRGRNKSSNPVAPDWRFQSFFERHPPRFDLGLFEAFFGRLIDENPVQTTGRVQLDSSLNGRNPIVLQ